MNVLNLEECNLLTQQVVEGKVDGYYKLSNVEFDETLELTNSIKVYQLAENEKEFEEILKMTTGSFRGSVQNRRIGHWLNAPEKITHRTSLVKAIKAVGDAKDLAVVGGHHALQFLNSVAVGLFEQHQYLQVSDLRLDYKEVILIPVGVNCKVRLELTQLSSGGDTKLAKLSKEPAIFMMGAKPVDALQILRIHDIPVP